MFVKKKKKKLSHHENNHTVEEAAKEAVQSSSLEIFKIQLDKALSNLVCTCAEPLSSSPELFYDSMKLGPE